MPREGTLGASGARLLQGGVEKLNGWAVNAYKAVGFVFLLFILVGLVAYVSLNVFYMFDRRWVSPVILTASHERVLELGAERARRRLEREEMSVERQSAAHELAQLDRRIDSARTFLDGLARSLDGDAALLARELRSVRRTLAEMGRRVEGGVSERYASRLTAATAAAVDAGLVDRSEELARRFTLSRVADDDVSRARQARELRSQAEALERRIAALGAVEARVGGRQAGDEGGGGLTYEALLIDRERRAAELEIAELEGLRAPLEAKLAALDASLGDYDRMIAAIGGSPYLRALDEEVAVAFVPYENLDAAAEGAPLYACALGLVWCERVGEIVSRMDGEIRIRHPLHNRELRGVLAEIRVGDLRAARQATLHAGSPPLLL